MFETMRKQKELYQVMEEAQKPVLPTKSAPPVPRAADPKQVSHIEEYARLAAAVGIMPPDLAIESFKQFMASKDLPIYNLNEVIAYMDKIAAQESKHQAGWEWRPLREKDHLHEMGWGNPAKRNSMQMIKNPGGIAVPASDYYRGTGVQIWHDQGGREQSNHVPASSKPYNHTIPLHALRRMAVIEAEHTGPVSFFVSDYALAPMIHHPDPFLMAVVPNPNVANGTGRFVIDVWDEPGFGIEKMLK